MAALRLDMTAIRTDLAATESRLRRDLETTESRLREYVHDTETKIVGEFYKWSRTNEARIRTTEVAR